MTTTAMLRLIDNHQGTAKVGTATDQPFIRRVHLAVGAHIRHMYTDYDSLLRTHKHNWLDARAMVQPVTLDKIIEWRDEKDEPDAVEDILREVIVIPDDEEDESDDDQASDRYESVEVISSHAYADNVHIQPIDYGALDDENRLNRQMSPEDDWAPSVRFIRRISPPAEKGQRYQDRVDRQHAHRTRVWQEAVSRRKITAQTSHDTARHSMYNPHDQRLAPSNPPYSELASSDLRAHESGPGFPKLKSAYADADSSQPSVALHNVPRNVRNADDRVSHYKIKFVSRFDYLPANLLTRAKAVSTGNWGGTCMRHWPICPLVQIVTNQRIGFTWRAVDLTMGRLLHGS